MKTRQKDSHHRGKEMRERFEKTMAALFQVKKSELEKKPRPLRKDNTASKD